MTHQTIWFVNNHLNTKKIAKEAKTPKTKLWNHIIIYVRNSFIDREIPDLKLKEHLDYLTDTFDAYCEKATEDAINGDLLLDAGIVFKKIYG